jgi:YVTN family beta-propeller protein
MAPFAYVTNNGSGSVSVIDTATNAVVATPSVDGAPLRIAVTPDGTRAYIASRGDDGIVSVLDTATNTVAQTIPAVTDFFIAGVAITPDGKRAYLASSGNDHTVKVLETATNTVAATIPMENSIDIAITPDGKHAYVTNFEGVSVIDTATNKVETTIQVGKGSSLTTGRGDRHYPKRENRLFDEWRVQNGVGDRHRYQYGVGHSRYGG